MAAPPPAVTGNRILVLGADLAVIEPVVTRLEDWGAAPVVLFDVPAAMNALLRSRPYLVVLDASFGSDLAGLLSVLQGDRALPADARRAIPTLLLTGPETPSLATVLGPSLGFEALRHVRPVRYDQPLAVESALREALQVAGLSSYAPLAFEPVPLITPEERRALLSPPARAAAPAPLPVSRPPDRRATPLLLGLALLALLAIPAIFLALRLSSGRPPAQLATPGTLSTPSTPGLSGSPATAGTAPSSSPPSSAVGTAGAGNGASSGTPGPAGTPAPASPIVGSATGAGPGAPAGSTPGTGSAPVVSTIATPGPLDPLLDPLRNLLGPLLGQPPAAGQPGLPGQLGQPGAPVPPAGSAPRVPFCGAVEQWRPLVREALADAAAEGRLAGAAGALDDDLLLALILRESTGDPRALNTGGADEVGLLQLLPTTFAEQLGRSPTDPTLLQSMQDPRSNLRAGVRYLARAFASQAGDLYWSLVAYRAGLDGATAMRRAGGTPIEIDARIRATLETYARHRPDVRLVFVPSPGAPATATIRPVLPAGSC